ncbi:MAG: ATP/GTP-binding protein [Planctomycetaceae bacterium]
MLTSFSVKNFRCFHDLTITGLERINLIAGKNNVGKTSLLEAIHLHCLPDKPRLWIKVHKLRGIEDPLEAIEEIADWNFHHGNRKDPIVSQSCDNQRVERETSFHLVDAAMSRQEFADVENWIATVMPALAGSDVGRLILQYSHNGTAKSAVCSAGKLGYGGVLSLEHPVAGKIPNLFLGSLIADEDRDIHNFGVLKRDMRDHELVPPLQHIEPRLRKLDLVPFAGMPRIHGKLEGFRRLVPLSQIGEGMRRLLSILLAIANVPGGIVFIDEIENGLHYSVHTQVWKAIAEAARNADVQVFATTHSWECLRYAHEAFSEDEIDDFRLHRLDRANGEITATTYDRETIDAALTMGVEVR